MTLSCVIIEDEPLAMEKLEGFIERIPSVRIEKCFDNALDGLHFLETSPVNILFLDIQMEGVSGIQLLENLKKKPYVIVISAYSEYALKGYELSVFDYLLKPYSFERLLSAVQKVTEDIKQKTDESPQASTPCIFVRTEYRLESINLDDILYIEGMQGYLKIYLKDKRILTKQTLKGMLATLPTDQFIQVHKSYIVALAKIESIEQNKIRIGQQLIPMGNLYKKKFYESIHSPLL